MPVGVLPLHSQEDREGVMLVKIPLLQHGYCHCQPTETTASLAYIRHLQNRNRWGVSSWLNNKSVIGGTTDEAPLVVYNSFAFQLICDCCSSIKDYPIPYLQEKSTGRKEGSKQVEWRPLIRTDASYAEIQLECKCRGTGDPKNYTASVPYSFLFCSFKESN